MGVRTLQRKPGRPVHRLLELRPAAPLRIMSEMSESAAYHPPLQLSARLLWRVPLFLLHVFIGLPLTLACFLPVLRGIPVGRGTLRQWAHRAWQRQTLCLFGIQLKVSGQLPDGGCLVVANHISWLDIVVLHAVRPMWLVAKAEIRRWPLVGWLAHTGGTLFIQRGRPASRKAIARRMAALLRRGETVGIFPEGGIRPELGPGRFYHPLFQPAVRAGVPVVPVAIRYQNRENPCPTDLHEIYVMRSGENFLRNFFRLMAEPPSTVQVKVGQPIHATQDGHRPHARQAGAIVRELYHHA